MKIESEQEEIVLDKVEDIFLKQSESDKEDTQDIKNKSNKKLHSKYAIPLGKYIKGGDK